MASDGLGRKLAIGAAALGAILLVLRVVGGRGGDGVDEGDIDRVDTGRSDEDDGSEGGPVDTGLERVSTDDADEDEPDDTAVDVDVDTTDEDEGEDDVGTASDRGEDVPVVPTGGRFDDLDVFDIISVVSAGVEAAREEYHSRT